MHLWIVIAAFLAAAAAPFMDRFPADGADLVQQDDYEAAEAPGSDEEET